MKKFYARDYFLSEKHAFSLFCLNQKDELDVHTHDFDEIVIVTAGSGFHLLNDAPHFISQGDFFFVNYSDVHYFESINKLGLVNILLRRDLSFHFLNDNSLNILKKTILEMTSQDKMPQLDSTSMKLILTLINDINEYHDDCFDTQYFINTESLILNIFKILLDKSLVKNHHHEGDHKKTLLNYVKTHYAKQLNWNSAEIECGVNRRTIYRFFNEVSGLTPNSFLQQYRIYKVREYLRTTEYSIKDIAQKTGFLYSSHLSRAYKDKFNQSPSQERNSDVSTLRESL